MTTWTVISTVERLGGLDDALTGHPFAAIEGRAEVAGFNIHTAVINAATTDAAFDVVREAFRIAGNIAPNCDPMHSPIVADRWTVIGTATNGVCATHNVLAVVAGEHTVHGRCESMLSHRWERVVDAPDVHAAESAGHKAAAEVYDETWD
ncbi:hypothetical protein AB0K35_27630 [Micromonospora sp. NPDC053740]|uniref:hypothetical protein n=1 Tax=Micromonospora sp. NPDC053740 TaxID=3155173 RepID=UPI003448A725